MRANIVISGMRTSLTDEEIYIYLFFIILERSLFAREIPTIIMATGDIAAARRLTVDIRGSGI